ncbi:MAG: helix-turn-helix domain-containing protein [Actinomycetia bacterium]|nr:helix-turn-helix domain-containing protein [Actinomycetes bacterium]
MPKRSVEIGLTGETVRANVKRLRRTQGLTLRDLSDRMKRVDRPMGHSTISEIERGARRVDVDDLMALAVALGVWPATLLMPEITDEEWPVAPIDATGFSNGIAARHLWAFLKASSAPPGDGLNAVAWFGRSLPLPALSVISHGPIPDEDEA